MSLRSTTIAAMLPAVLSCGPDSPEGVQEPVGTVAQAVDGTLTFVGCTADRTLALGNAIRLGRWISDTAEYQQCIRRGPYAPCGNDDVKSTAAGIAAANRANAMELTCGNLGGINASASWNFFASNAVEAIRVDNAFIDSSSQLSVGSQARLAKILWHEVMHRHGFVHDASCPGGSSKSMPLITENCMQSVPRDIARSRLAASGYTGAPLNSRANLFNAGIAGGGIASDAQLDTSLLAVAWERLAVAGHSQKCLTTDAGGTGAAITQRSCAPGASQRWVTLPLPALTPPGSPTQVLVMNLNGLCMDRPFGQVADHTPVQQYPCHGGPAQRFVWRSNNQFEAIGVNGLPSGQCLDITGEGLSDGVGLQMGRCKAVNQNIGNQIFELRF